MGEPGVGFSGRPKAESERGRQIKADPEVVQRAIEGDNEARSQLIQEYYPLIMGTIMNIVRDADKAVDIAQRACEKMVKKLDTLEDAHTFAAWLGMIARNEALMSLRGVKKDGRLVSLEQVSDEGGESTLDIPMAAEALYGGSPEHHAKKAQEEALVQEAVEQLTGNYRAVIDLELEEGLDLKETAERLGLSVANVKSLRFRARKKMRDYLAQKGLTSDEDN